MKTLYGLFVSFALLLSSGWLHAEDAPAQPATAPTEMAAPAAAEAGG